ncbi:hypothetical protein GQ53DRAFT_800935 [Thozetella sp. PMI_491]|nr:hypothetical protein GQ53DRAFT_800935 [Thozetella sp. PMI_491]
MSLHEPLEDSWFENYEWQDNDQTDYLDPDCGQPLAASPAVDDVEDTRTVSSPSPSQALAGGRLPLLRLAEWDERKTYDEHQPICIHYSIEWKLTVNGKVVSTDSEPILVLAPSDFWEKTLRNKLDRLLKKKLPSNKSYKTDDTNIVVFVRDRSERDLTKRFDDLDIEWPIVENQLQARSHLFRAGRRLRIDMSFNYIETGARSGTTTKRGTKRGFASISQQMLSQRDIVSKKRYRLKTHHFKTLVEYIEQGGRLQSHDDMPEFFRQQLFAEEQRYSEEQQRKRVSTTSYPPINITNVMPTPTPSPEALVMPSAAPTPAMQPVSCVVPFPLEIPGPRDVAVKEYCEWQGSQVEHPNIKEEFRKIYLVMMEYCLDLEQVYEDQDSEFFIQNGVKIGVARRFVRDIGKWAKLCSEE